MEFGTITARQRSSDLANARSRAFHQDKTPQNSGVGIEPNFCGVVNTDVLTHARPLAKVPLYE